MSEAATKIVTGLAKIAKAVEGTKIENPSPEGRRRNRRKVRAQRAANSRKAQQATWEARFNAAETPQELLSVSFDLLRTRLFQTERKAAKALEAASTEEEKTAARKRCQEAQEAVERICGEAAAYLAQIADQLDTTRR